MPLKIKMGLKMTASDEVSHHLQKLTPYISDLVCLKSLGLNSCLWSCSETSLPFCNPPCSLLQRLKKEVFKNIHWPKGKLEIEKMVNQQMACSLEYFLNSMLSLQAQSKFNPAQAFLFLDWEGQTTHVALSTSVFTSIWRCLLTLVFLGSLLSIPFDSRLKARKNKPCESQVGIPWLTAIPFVSVTFLISAMVSFSVCFLLIGLFELTVYCQVG